MYFATKVSKKEYTMMGKAKSFPKTFAEHFTNLGGAGELHCLYCSL